MYKKNKISIFLILFLFILISLQSFPEENKNSKIRLQLNDKHKFQFAGYYAAKEKNYYESKGLDVEIKEIRSNENPVDVVLRGEADIGIGGSELIIERAKGKRIVLLASIFQHSPSVFISLKNRGINNIHQIEGKTISIGNDSSELLVYLQKEGINIKDLKILPYKVSVEALENSKIDIISVSITDEIFSSDDFNMKYNVFNPAASGVDFYGDSLFTTEEYLRKNPQKVKNFLNVSLEGWDYALRNRSEMTNIINEKYSKRFSKIQLMHEAYKTNNLIVPQLVEIGFVNKGRWEVIAEEFKDIGIISKNFDTRGFFYRRFVEIDSRTFNIAIISTIILIIIVLAVFRIITIFNAKLKLEMKEKNSLLEKVTSSEVELRELMTIIEHSPISVVITDAQGKIRYGNNIVFEGSGYTREEVLGKNVRVFKSGYHTAEFYKKMWETISGGSEWQGEFYNKRKNGEYYWEKAVIIPVKNSVGEIYSYLALKEDITETKERLELLHHYAEKDSLTGIYNRRVGIQILENEIKKVSGSEKDLLICFIDLNKLKYVNDTFGHDSGDEMIKEFVNVVSGELRGDDTFFRLGGDEFIIIFKNSSMEIAEKVWDRIENVLDKLNVPSNKLYNISASHGIVKYNHKFKNVDEFIMEADQKMYEEKKEKSLRKVKD